MKKYFKIIMLTALICLIALTFALYGCVSFNQGIYVTNIVQTASDNSSQTFTIYYSDGTTSEFTVSTSGRDGKDGASGRDGKDGRDLTAEEIYQKFVEEYGELTYAEFLDIYLSYSVDSSTVISDILRSTMKVYTEFIETTSSSVPFPFGKTTDTVVYTGSAVIWSIDEDLDGYTYIVTNYHVVYDNSANATLNGGYIARKIYCYVYGSENTPTVAEQKDGENYTVYDYGEYAVQCEYVGGSITYDVAVLRTKTAYLTAINDGIKAVMPASAYHVGQTAIAVGNAENYGLSVTQGIVSVENEYISLNIDDTFRSYRSIRMDTAIYGGNSGGGLFNSNGQLIGLCNAGDETDQSINFAVPIDIVRPAVENILYYFNDGDNATSGIYSMTLGVTVLSKNVRYVYNPSSGYGGICEDIVVGSVIENSPAQKLGLQEGDVITAITVNGKEYSLSRSFNISDILMTVKKGDTLELCYLHDNQPTVKSYTVTADDLKKVD